MSCARGITVCACTYRRPDGLKAMLEGLGRQRFEAVPRPSLHIVIADNEGSAEARRICERFQGESGIPLTYVHEPRRGISFARNACLDNIPSGFEFFAFIDDDEVPEPNWLDQLLAAQALTGADVVEGPVIPELPEGAPQWLVAGRFLGRPRRDCRGTWPVLAEHEDLIEAATSNVLVRRASVLVSGLRFDPAFALTGGGDTVFFRALKAAGNRIVYAPKAVVREVVPKERATLLYRLELEYRVANNRLPPHRNKQRKLFKKLRHTWRESGFPKICSGLGLLGYSTLTFKIDMDRLVVCSLRVAYGLGQLTRLIGIRYHPYG